MRIRTRYALFIFGLITTVVLILSGTLMFQFRKATRAMMDSTSKVMTRDLNLQLQDRAASLVQFIARDLVNPMYRTDVGSIYEIVRAAKKEKGVQYVFVYDLEGKIIHDGKSDRSAVGRILDDDMSVNAVQAVHLLFQTNDHFLDVAAPILIGDKQLGGVRIGFTLSKIKDDLGQLKQEMDLIGKKGLSDNMRAILVLTLVFSLLGIGIALVVSRNLSRPIVELIRLTKQIGHGEYKVHPIANRADEVGELAVSFQKMAEDLEKTTVSKRYVDDIIGQMIDILIVVDLDGKIKTVNSAACTILDYAEKELVGDPFETILGDEMFKRTWFDTIQRGGKLSGLETSFLTKGGRKLAVQFSGALMYDDQGAPRGIICVAQDITQLKKHEKFAAIGQLASSVAHELRNPLGAIQNALYYLKDALASTSLMKEDPTVGEFLDISEKEINRSNQIVGELLEYSREVKLKLQPADMNTLVEEATHALRIPETIKIDVRPEEKIPVAMVDPQKLHQVFLNLMTNAIQAMPQGGHLNIAPHLVENGNSHRLVSFEISDTGSGISEENLKHIFEPLFTTKTKGTGLGLAICQEIVRAHGGNIDVRSSLGKGTTFIVNIPLVAAA